MAMARRRPSGRGQRKRAPQKREGIVMLIVMLMLLMATASAMFAIQSTHYEQRASSSLGEANWARGVAESATRGALAYVENVKLPNTTDKLLGTLWIDGASKDGVTLSQGARKFAFPTPNSSLDRSQSVTYDIPPFVQNLPAGLRGFLPGDRCPLPCTYPMRARRDQQGADPTYETMPADSAGLTYMRPHWLTEKVTVPRAGQTRVHNIVTGFGEVHVWGDPLDSSRVREAHEIDAIARGTIDITE
jgi:hypothetical protein